MRIGILTGGGDCPGLNAVIRAVVRKGIFHHQDEFVGFLEGWRGVMEDQSMKLTLDSIAGILPRGGTILRTSRTNPAKKDGGMQRCLDEKTHLSARCCELRQLSLRRVLRADAPEILKTNIADETGFGDDGGCSRTSLCRK